ncbi:hypothetical protein CEQ90_12555 [Lewinellaceae bacterium SD302]|nr:hypothetical protein CEQ90_12555 [Lewinellaceae bacterium SD302]
MPKQDYRSSRLRQTARELGMEFQDTDQYDLTAQLTDFRLFSRGSRKRVSNIMRRQDGLMEFDIRVFDYRYLRWNGNKMKTHQQTVFYLQSTQLGLPEIWLQPESIFHKIGELFGRGDIDFVRFPKFSGQYRLTGDDEVFVRHHFNDEILNYFTVEKGWSMEGVGYFLILYKKDRLMDPKWIKDIYGKGMKVFEMLKQG